jgi:hypothetical protein
MPNVTLMATITLSQLNREEWEEAGFDPEDYADGHGGAVGAITPTLLAAALNEISREDWQNFLEMISFDDDDTAGGKVSHVKFAVVKGGA